MQIDFPDPSAAVRALFVEEGRVVAKLLAIGGRQQFF